MIRRVFGTFNMKYNGLVRFAEKTSRNTVSADLLWEENTVPAEKTN